MLNQAALSTLPTPVRRPATDWTDPASLVLDGASVLDRLPAGARVLFAAAVLPVDRDRAVAAQARPTARLLATQLLGRLSGDPTEREWRWRLYGFLNDAFGSPPTLRPPGGTLFEHVLVVLEADGHLVELYDPVNASRFFGLRHRLLQHSLATRYADHPRVRRLLTELSERSLAATRAGCFPDAIPPEIWLDGDSARRVRVGEVLGDRDSLYLSGKDLKELKPERAQQLRQACEQIRIEMHRQVASDDGTEYSDEAFATEVLTRAARAVKITEKDFAEITIQRSIKIVRVSRREVASLPSFEVAFRFVERRMGGSWVVVSDEVRESADDFEARLIYWALGRAGEVYEVIGLAISVVGLVAVAWSAGIVAALISLAGGGFAVGVSIGIAEVIYIFRVVFGDATWSVRGFLLAALEGYLMALDPDRGRARPDGGGPARHRHPAPVPGRLGGPEADHRRGRRGAVGRSEHVRQRRGEDRHRARRVVVGAGVRLAPRHRRRGRHRGRVRAGPGPERGTGQGRQRAGQRGGPGPADPSRGLEQCPLSATLTEGLANLRAALTELTGEVTAKGFTSAFAERLGQVLEQMAGGAVARRVLELAGARFTRQATEGLQRFLRAAEAGNPAGALKIANVFAAHPAETVHFLEVLAQVDDAVARRLIDGTFGSRADLAAFLGQAGPPLHAGAAAGQHPDAGPARPQDAGLQVGPPVPGMTTEQLLQAHFDLSLRLQGAGARLEVAEIEREIARLRGNVWPGLTPVTLADWPVCGTNWPNRNDCWPPPQTGPIEQGLPRPAAPATSSLPTPNLRRR